MKLTAKQDHFARLVALEGLNQSQAYRQAYDAGNMKPATIRNNAYMLMQNSDVAAMVAELRGGTRHESLVNAKDLVEKLQEIATAPIQKPVKVADQLSAIDKLAKMGGFYRDDRKDREPVRITQVTVVLDRGNGEKATETHPLDTPDFPPPGTVDAESWALPEELEDSPVKEPSS